MILAVIVTYNPDIFVLKQNIEALHSQVDKILICDNASDNTTAIADLVSEFDKVKIKKNKKNRGLPYNYNLALRYCTKKGYDWLLTMDQDTIVPSDMIEKYSSLFDDEDVAIISPRFRDDNTGQFDDDDNLDSGVTEIKQCISSASLNRVSVMDKLGGFDERMFIDYVDYDYCRRVVDFGQKIVRVNDCVISHRVGNSQIVTILGRKVIAYNHSPSRKYYYFRNRVYFAKKHHVTPLNDPTYYKSMLRNFVVLFYEENKSDKIRNALKGMFIGLFRMPVGRF